MTTGTIPSIDLTPLREGSESAKRAVSRAIDAACRDLGFLMVVGHGVPDDQITTTRQRAIEFFDLPEAEKVRHSALKGGAWSETSRPESDQTK